jgi:hypothetical protein
MGYYVDIVESHFFISKNNFQDAYSALCMLNDHDEIKKGGGGFALEDGTVIFSSDPRPEGYTFHPAKWFSWMPANYPEIYKSLDEILTAVGYEFDKDNEGNIVSLSYSNKHGCEMDFLCTLAPFVRDNSYVIFLGEDRDDIRKFEFANGEVNFYKGENQIIWHLVH